MLSRVIALFVAAVALGADWTDYRPASVAKAWANSTIVAGTDYTVETANVKYTVVTRYTGAHRPIVSAREELLHRWQAAISHPEEYASMFTHEIQIREAKQEYWLLLQNSLLDPFASEAGAGSRVRLRIMYIGAVGQDRVFAVNGFEALGK